MTEIDQRVAVAELMGYKWLEVTRGDGSTFIQLVAPDSLQDCIRVVKGRAKVIGRPVDMDTEWKNCPDYLNDANAARQAVFTWMGLPNDGLTIHRSPQDLFGQQLEAIGEREQVPTWMLGPKEWVEALLRATNRWVD